MTTKIVHMTTVHPPRDTRIFLKMCRSLAAAGYAVHLVAPKTGEASVEVVDGVTVHYVRPAPDRLRRALLLPTRVLKIAASLNADLYHFHDPEILPHAVWFQRKTNRPVVYDSHEDLPLDVMDKDYIPRPARKPIARIAALVEDQAARRLAGVVATRKTIEARFAGRTECVLVRNLPVISELAPPPEDPGIIRRNFIYVGGIFAIRGIREMIAALPLAGPDARLFLAGHWESDALLRECRSLDGWSQTTDLGFLDRAAVRDLLSSALAGLVLFYHLDNHYQSEPTKMFEYMSASVPLIASDLPHWRGIIQDIGCGIQADPRSPEEIARAMRWFLDHPERAGRMGRLGREAVEREYNWENEFTRLDRFYRRILSRFNPGNPD